jgi:hypothetical protein
MAEPGEVLMPVAPTEALQHIEITVLRQIGENIAAQTRRLENLSNKLDDVRERVIRIEARETDKEVESLEVRVSALEASEQRVSGVAAFGSWLVQAAPWLVAAVAVVASLTGFGRNQ